MSLVSKTMGWIITLIVFSLIIYSIYLAASAVGKACLQSIKETGHCNLISSLDIYGDQKQECIKECLAYNNLSEPRSCVC